MKVLILTVFLSLTICSKAQKRIENLFEIEKTDNLKSQLITTGPSWVVLSTQFYDEVKKQNFLTWYSYDTNFNPIETLKLEKRPSYTLLATSNTTENRLNYYQNTDGELLLERISFPDLEIYETQIDEEFGDKWATIANTKFSILLSKSGQVFISDLVSEENKFLELNIPNNEELVSLKKSKQEDDFYLITKEKTENRKVLVHVYILNLDDGLKLIGTATIKEHSSIQYLNVFEYYEEYVLYVNIIPGKAQIETKPSLLYIVNLSARKEDRMVKYTGTYLASSLQNSLEEDSLYRKFIKDNKLETAITRTTFTNGSRSKTTNSNLVNVIQDSNFFVALYDKYLSSVSVYIDSKGKSQYYTTATALSCYVVKTDFDGNVIWTRRQVFEKGILTRGNRNMTTLNKTHNGYAISINNSSYSEILTITENGQVKSEKHLATKYLPQKSALRSDLHTLHFWNNHSFLRIGERKVRYSRSTKKKRNTVYYFEKL
jgi:hypothetical protein